MPCQHHITDHIGLAVMAPPKYDDGINVSSPGNVTNSVHTNDDPYDVMIWAVVCVLITLVGLGLATCKYFRDQYEKPENKKKRKDRSEHEKKEKEEKAVSAVKKEAIPGEQFLQKLKQKKSDKYLNIEVRAIVRNQDAFPCTIAMKPENILLNVNQDVVTYDHSRVVLHEISPDDDCNGYINSSFIDGYHREKEYIATQGPRQKTVASFWQMVWQEGVHCIVMATGLFENANQQCDKYWGDVLSMQKYVQHGNIHIWLDSTMEMAQLTIRTFRIQKEEGGTQRFVKHFEMAGFNDEATDPGFVLDCCRRVNAHMLTVSGPILVHCRCGGGKTAVYIAVDYCLKQLESEGCVDVYSAVLHLRKFRKNMVRTLFQYRLIYESIAIYIQCGCTVMPSVQIPAVAQRLALKDSKSRQLGYDREFQTVRAIVPKLSIGDCAGGHRSENRSKSRDIMMLPPERARPYLLTSESSDSGTDFINAVFVDGYYQENNFLVTQWPMQQTVSDIWRLVYDYKIFSLVVLNDSKFARNYPCFWPREKDVEEKFGPIGVKLLGSQKIAHVTIRAFAIRKLPKTQYDSVVKQLSSEALNISSMPVGDVANDTCIVKIFQLNSWPGRDKTPFSSKSLVYLMGFVEEWQQKNNPLNPVCVLSKDGFSRVGVYCVANICCDQLKAEGEVDVFNAVRIVKKNRPDLVPTVMEYIYCYTFIVFVIEIMQEDKPKIVITGPAAKTGQVNRGYDLSSHIHGDDLSTHILGEHYSDVTSNQSQLSFVTALDLTLNTDSSNLAARGKITTCKPPVSQLQIPNTDKSSIVSADSRYDAHCVRNYVPKDTRLSRSSSARSDILARSFEENNNIADRGSISSATDLLYCSTRSSPYSPFLTPSNSSHSLAAYADNCVSGSSSPRQDISRSRTRRPVLKRQDAEDIVEMSNMEIKNSNNSSFSQQNSRC